MLDEPITTYDGTGVHEHTLDELRGMDMNAFKTCININNKHIDDFMLMPITVYPASESTVRYVDRICRACPCFLSIWLSGRTLSRM